MTSRYLLTIPNDLKERAEEAAYQQRISLAELIRRAVEEYLERRVQK